MVKHRYEDYGIKLIKIEESYTSGISCLDNELPINENYNKDRRFYRELFAGNKDIKINADINAAC